MKIPSDQDREFYLLFRQQIVAEDNLVNHRMTWLLLMQGFLLALLAGILSQGSRSGSTQYIVLIWLTSVTGMAGSVLIGIGIWAARKAILVLKQGYDEVYRDCGIPRHLPPIVGGELPRFLGLMPLYLPFICFLVWVGILWILR
jgi:hypothetical protein